MGPPGSGKSTLGNALEKTGLGSYTELEPLVVEKFGEGDAFIPNRPRAHAWIRNFYREQVRTCHLPVVYETTGIGDREFINELSQQYALLFCKVVASKTLCLDRIRTRSKGRNVNASPYTPGDFYDFWYAEIEPTYGFDVSAPGTDIEKSLLCIEAALKQVT